MQMNGLSLASEVGFGAVRMTVSCEESDCFRSDMCCGVQEIIIDPSCTLHRLNNNQVYFISQATWSVDSIWYRTRPRAGRQLQCNKSKEATACHVKCSAVSEWQTRSHNTYWRKSEAQVHSTKWCIPGERQLARYDNYGFKAGCYYFLNSDSVS